MQATCCKIRRETDPVYTETTQREPHTNGALEPIQDLKLDADFSHGLENALKQPTKHTSI